MDVYFSPADKKSSNETDRLTYVDIYLIPQYTGALSGQKWAPLSDYQKAKEVIKRYLPDRAEEIYKKFNDCVYIAKTKGYEIDSNTGLYKTAERGKTPAIEIYHSKRTGPPETRLLMLLP